MADQKFPQGFDRACFVSFSTSDWRNDQAEFALFLERLHAQLSANAHANARGESYYLYNEHDGGSGNFRDKLRQATLNCVCLLSILSPNYWSSEECTLERNAFMARGLPARLGPNAVRGLDCFAVPWRLRLDDGGTAISRVIPANQPHRVSELSYFRQELNCPSIESEGLCAVLKRCGSDDAARREVDRYVVALADAIGKVIERFKSGLAPRRPMRHGKLYVLAASPTAIEEKLLELHFESEARYRSELYTHGGGPDWHPFTPGNRNHSIGRIVGDIVETEMKDEIVELLKSEGVPNLGQVIREAAERQEYAIVVVDPWSVHYFDSMHALALGLDDGEHRYRNMLLVVVRDPNPEAPISTALDDTVDDLFADFASDGDWYFVRSVATEDDFRKELSTRFVELRSRMQASRMRPVDRSGPRSPVPL
jgi:hypothetical protein